MGIMDKVKQQSGVIAGKAQEAAKAGQDKFGEMQEKRKIDQLLHDLGAAYYDQRKGTDNQAELDRLVEEISSHQAALDATS